MSLVVGLLALLLLMWLVERFLSARPTEIARRLRWFLGIAALLFGGTLLVLGRLGLAIPLAFFGFNLLRNLIPIGSWSSGPSGKANGQSRVRAEMLEIWLDPETGKMDGLVRKGRFRRRALSSLGRAEGILLHTACAWDAESLVLVEAYLDRRFSGWREDPKASNRSGYSASRQNRPMTTKEAYEILGLEPGASHNEITGAHRALLKRLHPDMGGSDWLAAKVNTAKDILFR